MQRKSQALARFETGSERAVVRHWFKSVSSRLYPPRLVRGFCSIGWALFVFTAGLACSPSVSWRCPLCPGYQSLLDLSFSVTIAYSWTSEISFFVRPFLDPFV